MNMDNGFPEWAQITYGSLYADMFLNRDVSAEAEFIQRIICPVPGSSVVDQGCGTGGMAIALGLRGINVTGIDIMPAYIETARENALRENLSGVRFIEGNIQNTIPAVPADAVFCWYTSWCHGETDELNLMVLKSAFRCLKPGGLFLLDAMNVPYIMKNFRETSVYRGMSHGKPVLLQQTAAIRYEENTARMERIWRWELSDGKVTEHRTSMLMYSPEKLAAMLQSAGFRRVARYGDISEQEYNENSQRLIVLSMRP